jgi:hypothetical protein
MRSSNIPHGATCEILAPTPSVLPTPFYVLSDCDRYLIIYMMGFEQRVKHKERWNVTLSMWKARFQKLESQTRVLNMFYNMINTCFTGLLCIVNVCLLMFNTYLL